MTRLNLVCLGKLKESYWREAEAEYLKRLQPWAKIEIKELKEESFNEKDRPETVKKKEAEKILAALPKGGAIVALDESGKKMDSVSLAKTIEQYNNQGHINIIIGGPLGLDESILARADLVLSLSPLTFTHQLARVVLWEQIYRALMISKGKKYHY